MSLPIVNLNSLSGNFSLSLEDPENLASILVNTERYKLSKDFYTTYLQNIEAVTVQDVQQAAIKYILPEESIILVVGKSSQIADKIISFSPTAKIETYDIEANPYDVAKKIKLLPPGMTAQSVFDNYIRAIGWLQKIEKIQDLSIKSKLLIEGNLLTFNLIYKIPGKFLSEATMNGQIFQKEILYHDNANVSDMRGTHIATGQELEKIIMDSNPIPELNYSKLGYKAKLIDLCEIDSIPAYMVEITSPRGNSSIDYFSIATGLKIKSVSSVKTNNGEVTQSTDFVEYAEFDGINYPIKMIQKIGSQSIDIEVDSINMNSGIKDDVFK